MKREVDAITFDVFKFHSSDMEVAMMNNGRPLSRKKTVRILIALTILVWATQTLMSQWSLGAEPEEKFVPGTELASGATIELRGEATVRGEEITLKQIARWSQRDEAALAPVADLVLARLDPGTPFRGISIGEIRQTLQEAGVNIAAVNFVGAALCTVNRSDIEYDPTNALDQWIEAKHASQAVTAPPPAVAQPLIVEEKSVRTLRDLLIEDLSQRLALPSESLQTTFRQQDLRLLSLHEPMFRFEIQPLRVRNLGEVSWVVLIIADEQVQKANITATARAWQNQLVVSRPIAARQIIRPDDLIERRTLVDRLPDEPLLASDQALGQQAARELKPGTLMTARTVEAVQLVKPGQFVTISLQQGAVNIKTVARALESGCYGQTIRVKNEATRDVFQVVMTGAQTATMSLSSDPSDIATARN